MMRDDNKYNRACLEAISGNVEEALALLRAALDLGLVERKWAAHDPDFYFIRDDPRFQALFRNEEDV
jgi:hypothetical protein